MNGRRSLSEEELAQIRRAKDPSAIDELVKTIEEQQRELDSLRLSMDVARRDREELRIALVRCREEAGGA